MSDQGAGTGAAGAAGPVRTEVKYLADTEDLAVYVPSVGGGDATVHQGNYTMQPITAHNAGLRDTPCSLDQEGFTLTAHASAVADFYDREAIAGVYEAEAKALVQALTGAVRVEIFDHTWRASSQDVQQARMIREPASIIHNDYSERSGPERLREHFADDPQQAEALLAGRFAIVNVWRSIAGTVQRLPLALCDAASVAPADLVPVERRARDRVGEIQLALHNPGHRWYYYPDMQPDEVLLIKTFDSLADGRARFTLHTAIDLPDVPAQVPSRESLETRCFVFF